MKLSNIKTVFRQNTDAVAFIFVLNILLFIPSLLTPVYRMIFTDYVLTDRDTGWLFMLMVMMTVTALFAGAANWLQRNCLLRLSNKIEISNLSEYMRRLFYSPLRLFVKKDSYTLLSQLDKPGSISKILTKDILSLLFDVFRVVFFMILMWRISVKMTLIVVVLVAANLIFGKAAGFVRGLFTAENADAPASAAGSAMQGERLYAQGLQNIEIFKSAAAEPVLFERLLGDKTAEINARRDDDFEEACSPVEDLPEILFLNILLLISALQIMDRNFSIGKYLEFQAYASAFFYPLSGVLSVKSQLEKFEKSLTKFFKGLKEGNEEKTIKRTRTNGKRKLDGYIEFRNVRFGYEDGITVISNFSLSVKPGQRVAIVGKSGAGKTTLLKLLQGLYEPDSGEVTIDGMSAAEIDRELFKNSVGCANQEVAFFSASVRENITMWDGSLTNADLYRAAHDAGIHQYVSSLDGAYEHKLAENGSNISKGQGQRIEIARALVYNPSVVLFDETTSGIDPACREHIQKVLVKRGCACIVVTHLLSQITDYDEIVILGKATVMARGKHDVLMETSPFYRSLLEAERLTVKT